MVTCETCKALGIGKGRCQTPFLFVQKVLGWAIEESVDLFSLSKIERDTYINTILDEYVVYHNGHVEQPLIAYVRELLTSA